MAKSILGPALREPRTRYLPMTPDGALRAFDRLLHIARRSKEPSWLSFVDGPGVQYFAEMSLSHSSTFGSLTRRQRNDCVLLDSRHHLVG
jgi:hypothetical protein